MENGEVRLGRFFRQKPVFASPDLMSGKQGRVGPASIFRLRQGKRNHWSPNGVNLKEGGVMSLFRINIISRITKNKPKISNFG